MVHEGSWAGTTMAPEGKDNLKGQACLGCKRNSLGEKPHTLRFIFCGEGRVRLGRPLVRSFSASPRIVA
jgi:hypothetical protein